MVKGISVAKEVSGVCGGREFLGEGVSGVCGEGGL